jgi:hypothetical protein
VTNSAPTGSGTATPPPCTARKALANARAALSDLPVAGGAYRGTEVEHAVSEAERTGRERQRLEWTAQHAERRHERREACWRLPEAAAREKQAHARLQQLVDREANRLERVIGDLDAAVIRVDGDCRRARQRWDHLTDFRGVVNGTAHQLGRHIHRLRDGLDQRADGHPGHQIDNQASPPAPKAAQLPDRDSPSL